MPSDAIFDVRPRTTGEMLDDAWRIYAAEAPQLLFLLGLFLVPAFAAVLLLVAYAAAEPPTVGDRLLQIGLAGLCAMLVPLSGVGSGACQEYLRRRAENRPVRLRDCLRAALRHVVEHSAARALLFPGVVAGLAVVLLPGFALWMYGATIHVLVADDKVAPGRRLSQLGREVTFDTGKAAVVVVSRLPLLILAVVNLHVFAAIVLWAAGNLAGFDVALLDMQFVPTNGAYLLSLVLLAWLLLAPFHEAANFLLYLDTRVRQEGLDLLFHVQRAFAAPERAKAIGVLLVLAAGLLSAVAPAAADQPQNDARLTAVRTARQDVERIANEVRAANPYVNGEPWEAGLRATRERLSAAWGARGDQFAWFTVAVSDFGALDQKKALNVLGDLQNRLSLLEEVLTPGPEAAGNGRSKPSKAEVKGLLHGRDYGDAPPPPGDDPHKDEMKKVEVKHDQPGGGGGLAGGGRVPVGVGGLGPVGEMVLLGLFIAVLVAGLVFLVIHLARNRSRKPKAPKTESGELPPDAEPPPHEQPVAVLWQQAEKLAQEGRYLDALRSLYRAVLSLLHRRQMLRYESTRTNGEYVQEVRLSPQAPRELREPFERLTDLFERKWYGDRGCEPAEFRAGHGLAEEIRAAVKS